MSIVAVTLFQTVWFRAVVYVIIAVAVARVVDLLLARRDVAMDKLLGRSPQHADRTRYVMFRRLVHAAIIVVGLSMALFEFPIFRTLAGAILASTAIIAGVVGIAARAPLANLVSGIMLAFSQPVRLGDYISVGDDFGTVEEITFTYTYIRTHDERRLVIPNEAFASQVVDNYSLGSPASMVAVDFSVPVTSDLGEVRAVVLGVADALAVPPEGRCNLVTVETLGANEVGLRLEAWAGDPQARRALASHLRAAVLAELRAGGVVGGAREASDAA